ncbi:IDEAL domain-containing protein [Cerasibacillus sp. JNUCC 74]
MKKQKIIYHYYRYNGKKINAKREIAFELRFYSRLLLDEVCFNYNKAFIQDRINKAIDTGDRDKFLKWSNAYRQFIWE